MGVNEDWPNGRALYSNADKSLVIWINEEEHLKIIYNSAKGNYIEAMEQISIVHETISKSDNIKFNIDPALGYVTSNP